METKEKIVEAQEETGPGVFHYYCPGCLSEHSVFTQHKNSNGAVWSWNNSKTAPTFKPSLLMRYDRPSKEQFVCHVFITEGKIQFLSDCTHWLKGKTVDMIDWPQEIVKCDCNHYVPLDMAHIDEDGNWTCKKCIAAEG